MLYLVFQNLFIFCEGEHLHRETFDVGCEFNPGVFHDRMEDCHIAVFTVLTAGEGTLKIVFLHDLWQPLNHTIGFNLCSHHSVSTNRPRQLI